MMNGSTCKNSTLKPVKGLKKQVYKRLIPPAAWKLVDEIKEVKKNMSKIERTIEKLKTKYAKCNKVKKATRKNKRDFMEDLSRKADSSYPNQRKVQIYLTQQRS